MVEPLHPPKFTATLLDGDVWRFQANHRAWYALEKQTECPLTRFLSVSYGSDERHDLLPMSMSRMHFVAWALTATHRAKNHPDLEFEDFLDLLPVGKAWGELQDRMNRAIIDAFTAGLEEPEEDRAQGEAPPAHTDS